MADDLKIGVVLESIDSNVKHIVEVVDTHTEQLKLLEGVPDKLDKIDVRLDAIETTLESANIVDLKEQVADIQGRVAVLESKEK